MNPALGMRVQPVALPKVGDHHLAGVFGKFEETVKGRIVRLTASRHPINQHKVRFFEYLLQQVDGASYAEIQQRFLEPARINPAADVLKYLDPITWFESKLVAAVRLGLHEAPPRRILDVGTGPGHFCVVGRFFGHDVVGTELPRSEDAEEHLYDALCEVFEVRRIRHAVQANTSLVGLGGPYDLVTGFLTAFNIDEFRRPWSVDCWKFFLHGLAGDVLVPGGAVFLTLTNRKITPEVWAYLRARATWCDDQSKAIFFRDLSGF